MYRLLRSPLQSSWCSVPTTWEVREGALQAPGEGLLAGGSPPLPPPSAPVHTLGLGLGLEELMVCLEAQKMLGFKGGGSRGLGDRRVEPGGLRGAAPRYLLAGPYTAHLVGELAMARL